MVEPTGASAFTFIAVVDTIGAFTPLNFTDDVLSRPLPWIVTVVPHTPEAGLKLAIVGTGDGVTVNEAAEIPVPPGVVTAIVPDAAPAGTRAFTAVAVLETIG